MALGRSAKKEGLPGSRIPSVPFMTGVLCQSRRSSRSFTRRRAVVGTDSERARTLLRAARARIGATGHLSCILIAPSGLRRSNPHDGGRRRKSMYCTLPAHQVRMQAPPPDARRVVANLRQSCTQPPTMLRCNGSQATSRVLQTPRRCQGGSAGIHDGRVSETSRPRWRNHDDDPPARRTETPATGFRLSSKKRYERALTSDIPSRRRPFRRSSVRSPPRSTSSARSATVTCRTR